MKKKLFTFLVTVIALLPVRLFAQDSELTQDFEYEYEGHKLTYTVIDEKARTCMTKSGLLPSGDYTTGNEVSGDLKLPKYPVCEDTGITYTLTMISDYAFFDCSELTSVTIPEGVTTIGHYAFCECYGLTSVTIPEGVTAIGDYAFSYCSGLTSVTIPESVTAIGNGAFDKCSGLTSVKIPEGVTIGNYAFSGCSGLTSLTIPEGVTTIGSYAFSGCSGLTSFTIPEAFTTIFDGMFSGWSGLTSVTIPEGVTTIGSSAFAGCSGLTSLTIPEGVTTIGSFAFSGCSGLTSLTIPEAVTTIFEGMFSGCSGLTSFTIPEGVTTIETSAFLECSGLTSLTIPESVTSIGYIVFSGCSGLTSFTIPENVTSIRSNAFKGCSGLRLMDLSQAKISNFADIISTSAIAENALIFVPEGTEVTEGRANLVVGKTCENLVINYGETANNQLLLKVPYEFTANNVTINRSFTEDQPYTLYLPFEMDASQYGTLYTGGEFNKADGMVYFTKLTEEKTTPNTPYMFQPNRDFTEGITIEGPVAVKVTPEDEEVSGFNGVYEKKEFTAAEVAQKIYYGWANGEFCWADEGAKVDACHAYFKLPTSAAAKAPARLKVKLGDDNTTGITDIDREEGDTDSPAYNINGQRVGTGYRGVVIKNGQKTANFAR